MKTLLFLCVFLSVQPAVAASADPIPELTPPKIGSPLITNHQTIGSCDSKKAPVGSICLKTINRGNFQRTIKDKNRSDTFNGSVTIREEKSGSGTDVQNFIVDGIHTATIWSWVDLREKNQTGYVRHLIRKDDSTQTLCPNCTPDRHISYDFYLHAFPPFLGPPGYGRVEANYSDTYSPTSGIRKTDGMFAAPDISRDVAYVYPTSYSGDDYVQNVEIAAMLAFKREDLIDRGDKRFSVEDKYKKVDDTIQLLDIEAKFTYRDTQLFDEVSETGWTLSRAHRRDNYSFNGYVKINDDLDSISKEGPRSHYLYTGADGAYEPGLVDCARWREVRAKSDAEVVSWDFFRATLQADLFVNFKPQGMRTLQAPLFPTCMTR